MKHCPTCKTNYADDTLQFCLEDGTPLTGLHDTESPTVAFTETEAETVVRSSGPTRVEVPPTEVWQEQQSQVTQVPPQQFQFQSQPPPPKKSNTALAIFLTALAMIILFGGIFGAWLLFRGSGTDRAKNKIDVNIYAPSASPTVSPSASVTPSPTASITPTTNPTPSFDAEQVKSEVRSKMNAWQSSMESGSLDSVMSHYAGNLEYYYRSGGTSSGTVRNNKKRAFELYNTFRVSMTNMNISPNETGEKATVTFTKTWNFQGSTDDNKGSVRAQFQVTKIGGSWYITGEKDL